MIDINKDAENIVNKYETYSIVKCYLRDLIDRIENDKDVYHGEVKNLPELIRIITELEEKRDG